MPKKSKETPPEAAGEQFVKVARADDTNPDAREHGTEETRAMLQGKNRTHFEGLGDAWAVLTGQNPAAIMPQVAGTVLHAGGTRPAWQWKRGGRDHVLMAWPKDQPARASVLMAGEEGGKLVPVSVAPLLEGLPNDLTVEKVHPWESGLGANVAVSMIEGKNPMWFFDPLYGRDHDDLTPGVTHTFLLAGLAYGLRKALLDEVTITQGPRFEAYAEAWLAENPGKARLDVPPLKVEVAGRHLIMPGRRFCEYQLRAVIEEVQDCRLEKMPLKILYLSFPFETREPMRLALYVSQMTLGDFEPEKGQEVDAYVWLQARIIDIDQGPQQ
ncbi:hypothetical protein [Desulfovibrio sp. SGI.169]|uniref:hypothetical protein n=1 Tax=Desulfovibrio sp. SGI.169 TaxID=3420561 RepID=UPI003D07FE1D